MDATSWLELRYPGRSSRTIPLMQPITLGRGNAVNVEGAQHVELDGDATVSRLHAALERLGPGWCVRALGATNGLFVNGERMADGATRLLHGNDEIRLGERTTVVFRSVEDAALDRSRTRAAAPPPSLTAAEHRVLVHLCLPMLESDMFTPPAKVARIAEELFVTQSAIKQHLLRLYQKFDLGESDDRRVLLAREAVQRGVVRRADLEAWRRRP